MPSGMTLTQVTPSLFHSPHHSPPLEDPLSPNPHAEFSIRVLSHSSLWGISW